MPTPTAVITKATSISGVTIPESKLAREATELVRDTESPLLFNHSSRVYYFASLAGKRLGLKFDPELLYIGAMFHDMGLTREYSSKSDRFEVDGANAARAFLRRHKISPEEIDTVWTAIALHTTPGIPQYMHPVVALLTNGVEMDVLGIAYSDFSNDDRDAIVAAYPRTGHFKEDIIDAFYEGIKHKPETTFGNVKADVLADKDPRFQRHELLQCHPRLEVEALSNSRCIQLDRPTLLLERHVANCRRADPAYGVARALNRRVLQTV